MKVKKCELVKMKEVCEVLWSGDLVAFHERGEDPIQYCCGVFYSDFGFESIQSGDHEPCEYHWENWVDCFYNSICQFIDDWDYSIDTYKNKLTYAQVEFIKNHFDSYNEYSHQSGHLCIEYVD